MSSEGNFYTTQQAAKVLGVPTQRVHELICEGELEARHDEETGRWLISVRSVEARLEEPPPEPPEPPEARGRRVSTREGKRVDLWILLIVAVVTLLAAGYTLLPLLLG
jgi:excisionase family DNA binding protein